MRGAAEAPPHHNASASARVSSSQSVQEEDLWLKVRTPFFKAWFGDWENKARRTAGHVTEDSAPVTPALSPASRVSHPYGKYTSDIEKSQVGLLDENGEPLGVSPARGCSFSSASARVQDGRGNQMGRLGHCPIRCPPRTGNTMNTVNTVNTVTAQNRVSPARSDSKKRSRRKMVERRKTLP